MSDGAGLGGGEPCCQTSAAAQQASGPRHPPLLLPRRARALPHPPCSRDATLQLGDLQKYGLADTEALYTLIYGGRGSMPG